MKINQPFTFRNNTFKVINSVFKGRFTVIVMTKHGHIYHCDWATMPETQEEIIDAWTNDRKNFVHIN
ncbi:MAG: hypothetical protein ACH0QD_05355 [Tepidibacillus sp.]